MAGRPREFDRDLALQQAMLAFWQHGYEGTSMADLVAATGLASARLYAAFGSRKTCSAKPWRAMRRAMAPLPKRRCRRATYAARSSTCCAMPC